VPSGGDLDEVAKETRLGPLGSMSTVRQKMVYIVPGFEFGLINSVRYGQKFRVFFLFCTGV
jgi:hypothetical protein